MQKSPATLASITITTALVGLLFAPGVSLAALETSQDIIDNGTDQASTGSSTNPEVKKAADEATAAEEAAEQAEAAKKAQENRNVSGQGFKLSLDFLTLKTKDSSGKTVVQGSSIFASKEYPVEKYGVLLGTFLRIIDILIYVIGSVALLTLIIAGILMISNHGEEGWVSRAKGMMLYSILGVLFALLSFIFVNMITSILA